MNIRKSSTFHLVSNSPWPITTCISLGGLVLSNVIIMKGIDYKWDTLLLLMSLIGLLVSIYYWNMDIVLEGTFIGDHTSHVQRGLYIGWILFLLSEVCVFFGLFFSYFYNSLVPSVEIGNIFPPIGIITLDYRTIPLLNTAILLTSGLTITACHNYMIVNERTKSIFYLLLTIILGIVFTYFQGVEYYNSFFTLQDSIYGSSFYILTGTHGIHIIIGTLFLIVTLLRLILNHFSNFRHLLFEFSALYWHLIDLVWLLLFLVIYIWAS